MYDWVLVTYGTAWGNPGIGCHPVGEEGCGVLAKLLCAETGMYSGCINADHSLYSCNHHVSFNSDILRRNLMLMQCD